MIIVLMPAGHFSLIYCIILELKQNLRFVPQHVHYYFINSRRRFFIYFRHRHQMLETMRAFEQQNIRYVQRRSLLPDREEVEQQGFHCNYKHKRVDFRKQLNRDTPYNEPKVNFDRPELSQNQIVAPLPEQGDNQMRQEQVRQDSVRQVSPHKPTLQIAPSQIQIIQSKPSLYRHKEVEEILNSQEIIRSILHSFNLANN